HEVIEETVLIGQVLPKVFQCIQDTLFEFRFAAKAAFGANAECGQAKPSRSDASDPSRIRLPISQRAVLYQSGAGVGRFPEVTAAGFNQVIEQRISGQLGDE